MTLETLFVLARTALALVAVNFGHSLGIEQAVRIGLLPDICREKIRFIGNSSLLP